jgi:hypothetical protein
VNYTPRRIVAWLEVMERIESDDKASQIEIVRMANAEDKGVRSLTRKLREQL